MASEFADRAPNSDGATAIDRRFEVLTGIVADQTLADSTAILFKYFAGGTIQVPAGASAAALTFYSAEAVDGTYLQLYDVDNAAVSLTIAASRAYPLPDECFAVNYLKIVNDTEDLTVSLALKG